VNCAAEQNGVDPLPPIRWCLASSRFVTGTAIPRPGNPAVRMLGIAGSAKWRSRPAELSVPPIGADVLFRSELRLDWQQSYQARPESHPKTGFRIDVMDLHYLPCCSRLVPDDLLRPVYPGG
jgi:hypothetical protein